MWPFVKGETMVAMDLSDEAVAAQIGSLARSPQLQRPIALAGFMAVGKTTLGRLLAVVLERPFFDTDSYVEAASGRSVDDFFLNQEEPEFRQREAEAVVDLLKKGPVVIALGGGALLDDGSREALREGSLLVHLHMPWKEMRDRITPLIATRPLLRGRTPEEIHELYDLRSETYRSAALRVNVEGRSPAEAAADVLLALRGLDQEQKPEASVPASRMAPVLEAIARARAKQATS
jgi:shikimate kinase